jgi:hypothetical protein
MSQLADCPYCSRERHSQRGVSVPGIRDAAVRALGGIRIALIPVIQIAVGLFFFIGFALGFWRGLTDSTVLMSPEDAARWESDPKLLLCRAATACQKYEKMRFECAAAGNIRTCLRIKMGEEASYIAACSGYVEGGPAVSLPRETPTAFGCFFHRMFYRFGR